MIGGKSQKEQGSLVSSQTEQHFERVGLAGTGMRVQLKISRQMTNTLALHQMN